MTAGNNKHIINNEIVCMRQLLFAHATILSLSKVSVIFNTASLHSKTNLPNTYFLHKHFFNK